mmetsp:Transcript_27293/g.40426  ORF Transcript_27293/g.40426 Transcript_27293/m.40426 type:complete len:338 (-) Transcript_27293:7-1020(-)
MKHSNNPIPPAKAMLHLVVGFAIIATSIAFSPHRFQQTRRTNLQVPNTNTRLSHNACASTECTPSIPLSLGSQETAQGGEEDFRASYPPRNPLFESTNVITKHMQVPNTTFIHKIAPEAPKLWDRITQKPKNDNGRIGVDITVEFRNAKHGAASLVQKCLVRSNVDMLDEELEEIENYIADALAFFQESIGVGVEQENGIYKARLVSSLGSVGQKCPRWHVDHVPLRLVMSLAGPGCIYIPMEKEVNHPFRVDRDALNELDDDDTARANEVILPYGEKDVAVYADKGDAVLLMGRAWENYHPDYEMVKGGLAAPHRSPKLSKDQLRVLLVVDLLPKS